jgi:hypothetical protein
LEFVAHFFTFLYKRFSLIGIATSASSATAAAPTAKASDAEPTVRPEKRSCLNGASRHLPDKVEKTFAP